MTNESNGMSASERNRLMEITKRRARSVKFDIEKRAAQLRADVERQLSQQFREDDERFAALTQRMREREKEDTEWLARLCREAGIKPEFAPRCGIWWASRGENSDRERRAELRKLGHSRIDALSREARHAIEQWQSETEIKLLASGLHSKEALEFFATIPNAEQLLPAPTLAQLDALATTPSLRLVNGKRADDGGDVTGTDDE